MHSEILVAIAFIVAQCFSTAFGAIVHKGNTNLVIGNAAASAAAASPVEPGQAEYRALLRDSIYAAIDAALFAPLPAREDAALAKEYRSIAAGKAPAGQELTKELMLGMVEHFRNNLPEIDQNELYRAIDQGSEQFSNAIFKTVAAANAMAAPANGMLRALERRGYLVVRDGESVSDAAYRQFGEFVNVTVNSTTVIGNSSITSDGNHTSSSYGHWMQTGANVIDTAKCVKDSITGHHNDISMFSLIPGRIGDIFSAIPSMLTKELEATLEHVKPYAFAAACVKELGKTTLGPTDPPATGALGVANHVCNVLKSGNSVVTGAAGIVNSLAETTIGAVPIVGAPIVGLKQGAQDAVSGIIDGGAGVVSSATGAVGDGVKSMAFGALKNTASMLLG